MLQGSKDRASSEAIDTYSVLVLLSSRMPRRATADGENSGNRFALRTPIPMTP
jgi:hypothetical protein